MLADQRRQAKMNRDILLIFDFLKRDLKAQYAGSTLGLGWFVLGPLLQIAIYAGIFGVVFKTRPMVGETEAPYVVFLCSALIPWTTYSSTIIRLSGNFLEHSQYIRKLNIPKWVFVGYVSLSSCVQFTVLYLLFLLLASSLGVTPSFSQHMLYLFFFLLGQLIATGFGLLLAVLTVFIRDLGQLIGIGIQLLFWSLPICYPESLIPQFAKSLVNLNPFFGVISSLRHSFFGTVGQLPSVLPAALISIGVIWVFAGVVYKKFGPWVVDEL